MLYRTNRTLSAQSNRLYLGTRSLVLATGANNNGKATQRIRHAHAFAMCDGMPGFADPSARRPSRVAITPPIPCSSPRSSWPSVSGPVVPEPAAVSQASESQAEPNQTEPRSLKLKGRGKPERGALSGPRPGAGYARGSARARAYDARSAAAAATVATAAGG